jgi:hypothetical protein
MKVVSNEYLVERPSLVEIQEYGIAKPLENRIWLETELILKGSKIPLKRQYRLTIGIVGRITSARIRII